jgi:glycosyltransferase involved in cell wall biosynthesis
MKMPRIVFIVTARSTAEMFVMPIARRLSDRGVEVFVVADGLDSSRVRLPPKVSLHSVNMRREPAPIPDLLAGIRLYALLRRLRPSLVVYATPKAGLLGSLAARHARVPHRVYMLWGLRLETTRGVARTVFNLTERLTHSNSTLTIANSRSLAYQYVDQGLAKSGEVIVIGEGSSHGVDIDAFHISAKMPRIDARTLSWLRAHQGRIIFGYVGRLNPDKGIDTLRSALELVSPQAEAALLVVGGADGATTALASSPIPVHLVGHVDDIRPYLAQMRFLVLPSRREGFPNVVLEAGAMALPSIVSDATGCVDSVVHGVTGLIFSVGDEVALAHSISTLASDADLRRRLGAAARTRIENHFAQDHVIEANIHCLLEEVNRSQGPIG